MRISSALRASAVFVFLVIFLNSCVTMGPQTFDATYLPEFTEGIGGQEFPLELVEKKDAKKKWAMYWLTETEVTLSRIWWEKDAFKPSFSDMMIININTGETKNPNEEESAILIEMIENMVERRPADTGSNIAASIFLTLLTQSVQVFQSFEGTIRNLASNLALDYKLEIHNQLSKVEFITSAGDKYKHMINVPQSNLYLSPDGQYVYFPYGLMVKATDPNLTHNLWTNYRDMVTSCMNPGWTKVAILEKNTENQFMLRVAQFIMPEEEL